MTEPTDAEIDAAWREAVAKHEKTADFVRDFARTVLAMWGAPPAVAGEPVAWLVCTEEGDPEMAFLDRLEACQYCEDDDPPKPLYLAAPPTAQAEGRTKPHRAVTYVCPVCCASLERKE